MTRRRFDDDEPDDRVDRGHRREPTNRPQPAPAGVLVAVLLFLLGLPVLMCAGCSVALFGVPWGSDRTRERAAFPPGAEPGLMNPPGEAPPPAAPPVLDPYRPLAAGDRVVLADLTGFVPVADTEKTLELFAEAEAGKKERVLIDLLHAGTVTRVRNGAEAKVVEAGSGVAKVSITGGYHDGRVGYAYAKHLGRPGDAERKAELARKAEEERKAELARRAKAEEDKARAEEDRRRAEAVRMDVRVASLIVKKVGGKHRYFFDIRNHDKRPFEGTVTITLLNNQEGVTNGKEEFDTRTPMQPGVGRAVYMEVNTGPVSVHGDWGVKRFRFKVVSKGEIVAGGTGQISDKYEDLSR